MPASRGAGECKQGERDSEGETHMEMEVGASLYQVFALRDSITQPLKKDIEA